jgi:hypothetical protein
MNWWKKAFAVDPPGPAEPTAAQAEVVDRICREVVRRHLTTPALAFLEMSRPLNNLGAQTLHFFQPIVSAVVSTSGGGYNDFAAFLEQRGSIEHLCRRIEQFEAEATVKESHHEEHGEHGGGEKES